MRKTFAAVLAAQFVLVASCALAAGWVLYTNARFGFAVEVPAEFAPGPEPENNDGRVFSDPESSGTITAFGSYNALNETPAEMRASTKQQMEAEGKRVTYEAKGKNWFVFSGYDGSDIFYEKRRISDDGETVIAVIVRYPSSEKGRYNAIVARASKSLHFVPVQ